MRQDAGGSLAGNEGEVECDPDRKGASVIWGAMLVSMVIVIHQGRSSEFASCQALAATSVGRILNENNVVAPQHAKNAMPAGVTKHGSILCQIGSTIQRRKM